MLRVVLSFDCERFISLKQINPRWNMWEIFKGKINYMIRKFRYNERGFELVYSILKKYKINSTIMLVDSVFDIKKFRNNPDYIEIGYHTKKHLPLTLVSDEILRGEVKNVWGVKSITLPMWMIEDKKNPNRIYKELKKSGYTHTVYRGRNVGVNHEHYNSIGIPESSEGIKKVHVSNWFEGNSRKKHINEIKREIIRNMESNKVYLLTSHDFTHRNSKNLRSIIGFLKNLEKKRKIKIECLRNI